jgi:hypothetical protein
MFKHFKPGKGDQGDEIRQRQDDPRRMRLDEETKEPIATAIAIAIALRCDD